MYNYNCIYRTFPFRKWPIYKYSYICAVSLPTGF